MDISEGEESGSLMICTLYAVAVCGALYLLRKWIKGGQFTELVSAKGLVCVVTGANSGIGQETVRELNLRKAKVYMLCRNEEKADEAKRYLVRKGCDPTRLIFVKCDMCSFASVRAAAAALKDEPHIDVLINNAGIMFQPTYELTEDGFEKTWQTNHLGPFLLTELLLPQLKLSKSARIVNVSSKLHLESEKLNLEIINDKKSFGRFMPYNRSKLANVMHAKGLTCRLQKEGTHNVTVNSLHPGVVDSNLLNMTILFKSPLNEITRPIRWFLLKDNNDGAQTSVYLALSKRAEGISGKYFSDCALDKESLLAMDKRACEDLDNYSLEVTGLRK